MHNSLLALGVFSICDLTCDTVIASLETNLLLGFLLSTPSSFYLFVHLPCVSRHEGISARFPKRVFSYPVRAFYATVNCDVSVPAQLVYIRWPVPVRESGTTL